MEWECWKCSADDGCRLVDLTGGEPLHEPTTCPFSGSNADFTRVRERAAAQAEAQPETEGRSLEVGHLQQLQAVIALLKEMPSIQEKMFPDEISEYDRIKDAVVAQLTAMQ